MMKNMFRMYAGVATVLFTIGLLASYSATEKGGDGKAGNGEDRLPQVIRAASLEKEFYYAGEKVPTENFDVRERLERELLVSTYQHATTLLSLKKAARYFPLFDKVFKENGIPEDFRYMAVAESNLNNVVSSAGARGIWQFMQSAAEYYGLEVSDEVEHPGCGR